MTGQLVRRVFWAALAGVLAGCSGYQSFETGSYVERRFEERLPDDLKGQVEIPYELSAEVAADARPYLSPAGGERKRIDEVVDFIFSGLDLRYSLVPTRNASDTYFQREGNCLSFVNLFVGLGRTKRLNPFYVEVEDYQRWNYKDGVVVSRGHIVGGVNIDGDLRTYDFLPYRAKSYKDFKPIDDLTAMAHYYNNLGAEALMDGAVPEAARQLRIAIALAPDFDKAINNLGVVELREGRLDLAEQTLARGLELFPGNVALLTNMARVQQSLGNPERASELLGQIEDVNQTNPFFFVYRGEMALGEGDAERALEYMRQAFRTDSEVPEVHLGLAKVYLAMGQLDRAKHHIERALRLDATHKEARKYAALIDARLADDATP
jgi:Tfp pilus assembly protein PilF